VNLQQESGVWLKSNLSQRA